MRLSVVHETQYRYSNPVALSQQLLHLTPRSLPWQTCHSYRVEVDPVAGEFAEREPILAIRSSRKAGSTIAFADG